MEETAITVPQSDSWAEGFARAIQQQRGRLEEFLSAQRQRLQASETELAGHVQQLWDELQHSQTAAVPTAEAHAQELARMSETLERLQTELASRFTGWEEHEQRSLQQYEALTRQIEGQKLEAQARDEAGRGRKTDTGVESDYRRRYDMAMDDVRELKNRVKELEAQLAKGGGLSAAAPTTGKLDWEAEKRRVMAALEAEGDDDPDAEQTRQDITQVVQRTDRILAEKQREIDDLKQILDHQADNIGNVAVGATALGAMLDNDAIVREERENLRRLQQQWEERLRQSEVEISIERAKLARERLLLDDKIKEIESHSATPAEDVRPDDSRSEKPARGRWMARLGLKDPHEK